MAEEKKKTKRPTALKRDIRNEKRRMINKSFKSKVRTTLNNFDAALKSGEKEGIETNLSDLYSVVDKCVKRGIYKQNKADRMKQRAVKKVQV
ncbi:MAG: hypothetical protein S4CHLAM81_03100 [Chlamydiales bacterium]|nr:hypothetical protein [Chlamydiales bacterium]MCH9635100.1 hypothetical protein [Chlamydiales bacterium]